MGCCSWSWFCSRFHVEETSTPNPIFDVSLAETMEWNAAFPVCLGSVYKKTNETRITLFEVSIHKLQLANINLLMTLLRMMLFLDSPVG